MWVCVLEIWFFFLIHGTKFCAPFGYHLCNILYGIMWFKLWCVVYDCSAMSGFCCTLLLISSADCRQIFCICFSADNPFSILLMHNQNVELVERCDASNKFSQGVLLKQNSSMHEISLYGVTLYRWVFSTCIFVVFVELFSSLQYSGGTELPLCSINLE